MTHAASDTAAVARYWTPKRIAEATPIQSTATSLPDLPSAQVPTTRAAAKDAVESSNPPTLNEPYLSNYSQGWATASPAIGKLYYTEGQLGYVCSATVVGRNYILTAGHCGYDPTTGAPNTNFMFQPGLYGSTSYGTWYARTTTAYAFTDYINGAQGSEAKLIYDYSLIPIAPQNGVEIGDWVGYYPVLLNGAALDTREAFGYPDEGWWHQPENGGGLYLYQCDATGTGGVTYYTFPDGYQENGTGCQADGGFSGGPEFEYFNGSWYVGSVNSVMEINVPNRSTQWMFNIWGPSFTTSYNTLANLLVSQNPPG